MIGLALVTVLLGAPAQADASRVDVRSQHQIVTVDGKAWRWVRPGVPLNLDVKRAGKQRLALELIRVGVPNEAPAKEVVRVRVGRRDRRFTLKGGLKTNRELPGNSQLRLSYPVRHRLKLSRKSTTVVVTAPRTAKWGILVRATLSGAKAVRDDGGLALAPLGAPPASAEKAPARKRSRRQRNRRRRSTKKPAAAKTPATRPPASEQTGAASSSQTLTPTAKPSGQNATAASPTAPSASAEAAPTPAKTDDSPSSPTGATAASATTPDPEAASAAVTGQAPSSTPADAPETANAETAATATEDASPADAPPAEPAAVEPTPTVEHRPERPEPSDTEPPNTEPPNTEPSDPPPAEGRPAPPSAPPPPPDAPTESVEVIELIPEEPSTALLGPRKLGTGVPLLVEAQLSPPVSAQALGGLGNLAFGPGVRLLVGVNLGFFSRFTYGVGLDVDYQSASTDALPVARVRWQVAQLRARLEGAFDVLRLDIADVGTLHAGVLGGVGAVFGAHWVASGLDVATYPLVGPTARVGLTGGFTVGPGAITVSVPVDWSFGVGAVAGYAPLAATFFVGYRLEL